MKKLVLLVLFLLTALPVYSLEVPPLMGRVNDLANLLNQDTKQNIESHLRDFEARTSNQVAVLIIPSLEGEVLENYSLKVAQTWGLGQADKDNGVLLLIAKNDRKLRIEVGYGLEGALTDVITSQIIRNEITPQFKSGNFDAGILGGVRSIIESVDGTYQPNETSDDTSDDLGGKIAATLVFSLVIGIFTLIGLSSPGAESWALYFFLMIFWLAFPFGIFGPKGLIASALFIVLYPILKMIFPKTSFGKSTRTFFNSGSGSGGGGFSSSSSSGGFSGGGGSFGGGGSSGSW